MSGKLTDWARPHYRAPGGRPFVFYFVYGAFGTLPRIDAQEYRTLGVYPGLRLDQFNRNGGYFPPFDEGELWDTLLMEDPELARSVSNSDKCLILRGEIDDQGDLNYLRDSIGLLTYLLDHRGICIYDPQTFYWWEPAAWRQNVFEPASAVPRHLVVILTSEENERESRGEDRLWFHTRGMRKFGRPDLSIHNVPIRHHEAAIDMLDRFIELQAFGGHISEVQEIHMTSLPSGMTCHHQGDLDDPEFNNVHVEITTPEQFD